LGDALVAVVVVVIMIRVSGKAVLVVFVVVAALMGVRGGCLCGCLNLIPWFVTGTTMLLSWSAALKSHLLQLPVFVLVVVLSRFFILARLP